MQRTVAIMALLTALLVPAAARADVTLWPDNTPVAVAFGGAYYFGQYGARGLYRTDGTPAGTRLVARSDVRYGQDLDGLVAFGDRLVFTTIEGAGAPGTLFVSDGTAAGTHRALAVQSLSTAAGKRSARGPRNRHEDAESDHDLSFDRPIVAGNQLYVAGSRSFGSETLYRVDLASGAITPVVGAGLGGQDGQFFPAAVTPDGGLFFTYRDDHGGDSLWHVSSTGPAVRLAPGDDAAGAFGALGDELYFRGHDAIHGNEPWVTDGTPAGTHLVADLTPGAGSSDLDAFVASQGSMYVLAGLHSDGSNLPSAAFLLTGASAPAPVTWNGTPITVGPTVETTPDAVWFGLNAGPGTGPDRVRLRVPTGSTVAEQPAGPGFDENGALLVPDQRFFMSGLALRSSDAAGAATTLGTVTVPHDAKAGPEPTFDLPSPVGNGELWFYASVVDGEPSVLWRSDGTAAGTHPVVDPGQIAPVDSTLTATVSRRAGGGSPRWRVSGTVLPEGLLPSTLPGWCTGKVALTVFPYNGRRPLTRQRVPVRWHGSACVFSGVAAPSRPVLRRGHGRLTVGVVFGGSTHINPWVHTVRKSLRYA